MVNALRKKELALMQSNLYWKWLPLHVRCYFDLEVGEQDLSCQGLSKLERLVSDIGQFLWWGSHLRCVDCHFNSVCAWRVNDLNWAPDIVRTFDFRCLSGSLSFRIQSSWGYQYSMERKTVPTICFMSSCIVVSRHFLHFLAWCHHV